MLTKDQLQQSMLHEIDVIIHLASKMPEGGLEYRPSEGQRSALELMQYLTVCASMPLHAAVNGNWDHADEYATRAKSCGAENFEAAMREQADEIRALMEGLSHQQLETQDATLPWGTPVKLAESFLTMGVKVLAVYRMQFFLYLKAAGANNLGSANCWIGIDIQKQPNSDDE